MYEVLFSPAAARYLKKIKERALKEEFRRAVSSIAENPYAGSAKKGDLSGIYGYDVRRAGISYEIAYMIFENERKRVVVVLAGTRENFYEQLKKYMR
ncbi:MAG TPA: type II toxin-antitoxin system RelE/ParE family toxin [bacterium]|nr:type II toxin-antitoxin system RelE/ParE family toxin [bacterium]